MLQVYLDPCTVNSRKVLAGLDLLGTPFKLNHVDYFTGEHKSEEFKKINPFATVPAAVDGELTLTESNAILQYAGDLQVSPAYPKDLQKRAKINTWLLWEASAWFPACYVYLVENVVKPLLNTEPDQSVLENHAPKWKRLAAILNGQLGKTKWISGKEATIADIAIASCMHLHHAMKLPLDQFPNLKRWTREIEGLPSWIKTQEAVEKALLPHRDTKSTFNYTKDVAGLTELYFYEDEKSKGIHEPGDDPHEMNIKDGWKKAKEFSIDKEGFSFHEFHSDYERWEDEDAVQKEFYPDVVDFLKKATGARRVLVFDHTIRTKSNAAKKLTQETNTSQRAPVTLVHCDYTSESGPLRVKQLLKQEAEELLTRRVAFINVWKPIRNVVEDHPLAMCDVGSTKTDDFFKLYLRYRDRTGENYVMRHSPNHEWWYFPKMTPEQVILLKTYDSMTDGRARFVGHSAFEDPNSPPNAPFRESVEIRTIIFF